jgi:hypothetical protein
MFGHLKGFRGLKPTYASEVGVNVNVSAYNVSETPNEFNETWNEGYSKHYKNHRHSPAL